VWGEKLWALSGNYSETLARITSPPGPWASLWREIAASLNQEWYKRSTVLLGAYCVLGTRLSDSHAYPFILLQPEQVGLFLASCYRGRNQGSERLRTSSRSHSRILVELGLDPGPCGCKLVLLNCSDGTFWVGVWGDSSEEGSPEKCSAPQKAQWNLDIYYWDMGPGSKLSAILLHGET